MKKMWKLAIVPLAAITILAGCSDDSSRSVAQIGDESITEKQLNETLHKQHGSEMLDTLIAYKIVEMEAEKADIDVTDEEIEAEYKVYVEQNGGEENLKAMLQEYHMTEKDILDDIRNYLLTVKLLSAEIELTDEDVQAFFEANMDAFTTAEAITASHILVEDEALANELIQRINSGEDFTALAKEYSIEPGAAESGGALGTFGRGEMAAEFEQAAFAMEIGEISAAPVKTEFGYHIILVQDKAAENKADFEASKDQARDMLLEEKIDEMYTPWLEEKYEEYDVKRTLFE